MCCACSTFIRVESATSTSVQLIGSRLTLQNLGPGAPGIFHLLDVLPHVPGVRNAHPLSTPFEVGCGACLVLLGHGGCPLRRTNGTGQAMPDICQTSGPQAQAQGRVGQAHRHRAGNA